MSVRLLLDCDTGIDDALALLYLLAHPEAEVMAVASTAGNVPVDVVTANNLALLAMYGRDEIPVHTGATEPLRPPLRTCEDTHGPLGLGYATLPATATTAARTDAADAWIEASLAAPGELVGLVTGPLTNLALALRRDPAVLTRLRRLVIMGGAFTVPGNTTPTAEWNMVVDPEAAAEVFAACDSPDVPNPIVCGLDVTESAAFTPDHLTRVASAVGSDPVETLAATDEPGLRSVADRPTVRLITDALRFYFEFHHAHGEGYLAHVHDVIAAQIALDPTLATVTSAVVDVETEGRLTRGTTIADRRGHWDREPNAQIVTGIDPEAVLDELVDRLATLEPVPAG